LALSGVVGGGRGVAGGGASGRIGRRNPGPPIPLRGVWRVKTRRAKEGNHAPAAARCVRSGDMPRS
jgi:hypothetical protein